MVNKLKSIVVMLVFMSQVAWGMDVDPTLSGSWYNPNQSGHGLSVEVLDHETTIVYWYAYHLDGTPMFLVTIGENQGNRVTGKTYYNTGMKFGEFNPDDKVQTVWGTSTVTFDNCSNATLEYSSDEPGYGSGTIPMQRLASVDGLKCTNDPVHGNYVVQINQNGKIGAGEAIFFDDGYMTVFDMDEGSSPGTFMGRISHGTWNMTGTDSFEFEVTSFSMVGGWTEMSGRGEDLEDYLLLTDSDGMRLLATPIRSFQRSVSSKMLEGSYDIKDVSENEIIGSITIRSDGWTTGKLSDGCDIEGWIWSPDEEFNQVAVNSDMLNCSNTTWLQGAGYLNEEGDEIDLYLADGWNGLIWKLIK